MKKALAAGLVAWVLACPGLAPRAGEALSAPAAPATGKTSTSAPAAGDADKPLARALAAGRNRPGYVLDVSAARNGGTSALLYRMLAYALIILVLGILAFVVVKKVLPKIGSSAGKSISVVETVYLGPRKTLHLLQVGSQRFLVAGSRDRISMLGEVTSAFAGAGEGPAAGGREEFAAVLAERQRAAGAEPPRP